jgi:hypothetical protein
MSGDRRPHPKNVPGAFYVEGGCCTACGIPESEAPDLFAFDGDGQCYVKRQPSNEPETYQMLTAMWASEMKCIRYRGGDPSVVARLGALGEPDLCDFPPVAGIPVSLRNHVVFGSIDQRPVSSEEAVADFRAYWVKGAGQELRALHHKFIGPRRRLLRRGIWFEIAWHEDRYHRIYASNVVHDKSRVVMFHNTFASRGISSLLDSWLAQSKGFGGKQWYTAGEWAQGIGGSATPW